MCLLILTFLNSAYTVQMLDVSQNKLRSAPDGDRAS
jgi:hypothetical protein